MFASKAPRNLNHDPLTFRPRPALAHIARLQEYEQDMRALARTDRPRPIWAWLTRRKVQK